MDAKIISGQLASDCYPATPQAMLNEWASKSSAQWPNVVGIVKSATEPIVTDRDKLWIRVDGSGNVTGQFAYGNGQWHWPHETPANGSERRLWVGSEADLATYDGGAAGAIGLNMGAFWLVDHDFDGRIGMGPGAITGAVPSKTLAVNENYGEAGHMQTSQEVGQHTHEPSPKAIVASGSGSATGFLLGGSGDARPDQVVLANTYTAGQVAIPLIPLVRGIFVIKRSIRQFRTP